MATRPALLLLRRLRTPVLLSLAALLAPAHAASLSYSWIEHRVSTDLGWVVAGSNGSGLTTSLTFAGSGPSFDEVVEGNLRDVFEPPNGEHSIAESLTQAGQTSALTAAEIASNGVAVSGVWVEGPDGGTAGSEGTAEFRTGFWVDVPTRFSLDGEVDCSVFLGGDCRAFIIFTGADDAVLAHWRTSDGSDGGKFTGTLLPGVNYGMSARAGTFAVLEGGAGDKASLGAYRLHLELLPVPEVPEPASVPLWALGLTALAGAVRRRGRG